MRGQFLSPGVKLLGLLVVLICMSAVESFAQLELADVKQSAGAGSITLSGQVKNTSSSPVSGVTVYCDFLNGAGKVAKTEQTNLETDPLPAGKVSEFKCSTKASGDVKGYNFRFDRLFGGPLKVTAAKK